MTKKFRPATEKEICRDYNGKTLRFYFNSNTTAQTPTNTSDSQDNHANQKSNVLQTLLPSKRQQPEILEEVSKEDENQSQESGTPIFQSKKKRIITDSSENDYTTEEEYFSLEDSNNNSQLSFIENDNFENFSEDSSEDNAEDSFLPVKDNAWIQRVTDRMRPLSTPVNPSDGSAQEFKLLKKQWGYANYYEIIDSGNCPLCDHQPVGSIYKIINKNTGKSLFAASHCITQFKVFKDNKHTFFGKAESLEIINKDINSAQAEKNEHKREFMKYINR